MFAGFRKRYALQKRLRNGMVEYWINVLYLTIVLASFVQYRRFILAAHDIEYLELGFAVIKALILAKILMIGHLLRIGQALEDRPLAVPVIYKTLFFTLLVAVFATIEKGLRGLLNGTGFIDAVALYIRDNYHEVLAVSLMIFVAFLPYFSVKELARVIGGPKIHALFFQHRPKGE